MGSRKRPNHRSWSARHKMCPNSLWYCDPNAVAYACLGIVYCAALLSVVGPEVMSRVESGRGSRLRPAVALGKPPWEKPNCGPNQTDSDTPQTRHRQAPAAAVDAAVTALSS